MKYLTLLTTIILRSFQFATAQKTTRESGSASGSPRPTPTSARPDSLTDYAGDYTIGDSTAFNIILREGHLFFNTAHYGKIGMIPLGNHKFQLQNVRPEAFLSFIPDSLGRIARLVMMQKGKFTWIRMQDSLPGLTGRYRQDIDIYSFISITEEGGRLRNGPLVLLPLTANKYRADNSSREEIYEFIKDRKGKVLKLVMTTEGPRFFEKRPPAQGGNGQARAEEHISSRVNGFTRADSLQGMLTPVRTCYDVLFYDLNATIDLGTKSVHGNTIIRFRTMAPFDSIQVDLYANMKIEKILYQDQELSWSREYNAVYVHFPSRPGAGSIGELNIFYSGQPQIPEYATLKGGFFWFQDRTGSPWIESVCQGSGASLWWPCKDHLSDKPDSMRISITVPAGLTDISNGRLQRKTDLPGKLTRFDWYVSYPINNYNVVVNIGNYAHFSDYYLRPHASNVQVPDRTTPSPVLQPVPGASASHAAPSDTLVLNYYCMPYNLEKARQIFANTRSMLALYEKDFGPYPFSRDGFTLMESLYPMEHQGAVSIGPVNNPVNSDKWDSADLFRTTWHESAHEWWGNSVTCKDMADFWIHESFATYAELLAYENLNSKAAAAKYRKEQQPDNKEPIIGVYNVNNFHMGDMYPKGCLMLNTLRNVIGNDSLWFSILRGIQEKFRYRSVTTEDIVGYINRAAQKDYTAFFDQYLRHAAIPTLSLDIRKEGSSLLVRYKWDADEKAFDMPVKVTLSRDSLAFIRPTADWQTMTLQNMAPPDFKVDTDNFYIRVKSQ